MRRQPVKIPIILAILSALVLPIATLGYAGLYAMEFAGLLSIFSTASCVPLFDVYMGERLSAARLFTHAAGTA